MKKSLYAITDRLSTRKGMWAILAIWLVVTIVLSMFAPGAREYQATVTDEGLPESAKSVIAQQIHDTYFADEEGIPALLVISNETGSLDPAIVGQLTKAIGDEELPYLKGIVPIELIPPAVVQQNFFSEDGQTALVPAVLQEQLETKKINETIDRINELAEEHAEGLFFRVTGPAGIAGDTVKLFERADIVLLLMTVVIIFILLIIIYRSPLLVFIPLLTCAFVYVVVDKTLGMMGMNGIVELDAQALSIMTILLFASVTDYSLFVFSRFREELKSVENKFEAMKQAMRGVGEALFFSGSTVLAAMLVLFFAVFKEYQVFAPIFATTLAIVIIASFTLIPAMFLLFGRPAFWPKIPKVGDARTAEKPNMWSRLGRLVTNKPKTIAISLLIIFALFGLNVFNIKFEFNILNSFPEDMPSREGFAKLEESFPKGELAPTSVVFVSDEEPLTEEQAEELARLINEYDEVMEVSQSSSAEDGKVTKFILTFQNNPYEVESIDALERIRDESESIVQVASLSGELHFSGETAKQVDIRSTNDRDTFTIVILETLLILLLLWLMTKSLRMASYMMATILISYASALGLGIFLADLLFGFEAVSTRIPLYAFVFLVALGVDYNIMLVSRFKEERGKRPLKEAVQVALTRTGGVITSAGIILAATFAVLMTQPIAVLFVFGFIVALGIIMDVFLVRGLLLPALIMMFEKDKKGAPTKREALTQHSN